jgi:YbbR domain-containing protein
VKWSGWLFDNLGLKLFALLLAVLLYVHVLTDRTIEQTLYFPVVVESLPDSLSLASTVPAEIGVRLRGTGKQLIRLRYARPPVRLSLAGVTPGMFQKALGPSDVPLAGASDVTVLEVKDPAEVRLEVTRRASRLVPVRVSITGEPARGLIVAGEPDIRPAVVRVSGPASWVARQETLRTETVSIAGRRDTLEVVQALMATPAWAHATPGSVLVSIPIDAEATKTLSLPLEVRGNRGELRAELRPAQGAATWRGPRALAAGIEARDFRAEVDAGRRGRGLWTLPVVVTGAGSERLKLAPDSVRVVLH